MSISKSAKGNRFDSAEFEPTSEDFSEIEPRPNPPTRAGRSLPVVQTPILAAELKNNLLSAEWQLKWNRKLQILARIDWQINARRNSFFVVAAQECGSDVQLQGFETGCGWMTYLLSDLQAIGARVNNEFEPCSAKQLAFKYAETVV